MLGEKQRLQRERDRLEEDIKEKERRNQQLRERVERSEMEKASASQKVQSMRDQMKTMKDKMIELQKNQIDIGRNPGEAIEKVSNPIYEKMRIDVENRLQPTLEQNMIKKSQMESELAILNSQVYDEQMNQINCKQQIVEQKDLLEDLNQEVDSLKQRIGDMQERKATLNQKVEGLTE